MTPEAQKTQAFPESLADEPAPLCPFIQCPLSWQSTCIPGPQYVGHVGSRGVQWMGKNCKLDVSLVFLSLPAMSVGPALPVSPVASFKDLLMGIDLEPFNALQQNKEEGEGENYSPSGGRKMRSVKWEIDEGRVRVSRLAREEPPGRVSASVFFPVPFPLHDQRPVSTHR